jgi:HD-GYP domain-containing protein (c-di-GMP phosphodiesterase class II)/DNA-binding CsgD family transcriptional regulator
LTATGRGRYPRLDPVTPPTETTGAPQFRGDASSRGALGRIGLAASVEGALRLAEVLGALSLTTDLGAGVPFEKGLRTCVVASALATALQLDPAERRNVYFAALLRSLGCTAHSSAFAEMFSDDLAVQRELKTLDLDDPGELQAQRARFASWAGAARAEQLTNRFTTEVPAQGAELSRGSCEVSATLGARLALPPGALAALDEVYERYDGRGFPAGRAGEELTVAARIVHVAEQAVMAHYDGGAPAARLSVARRAGGQLDPAICAAFADSSDGLLAQLDTSDLLAAALAAEPHPAAKVPVDRHENVCSAFATFADLKGRFLLGHSAHVASLAGRAAELTGYDREACSTVRTSALLIDLGRVGVSSAIWDRPAPLGPVEWERVRLHSYWTERILRRCPTLERLAPLAPAHQERLDGSGYHRAARGIELSTGERLLAAADVFAALTEPRPHREPYSRSDAAYTLQAEVGAGRLDAEAAGAVIEAAGLPRRRTAWPNDLTDREIDVLRLLARGMSNREIADALVLSPRTVQHHLASTYDKINLRTRAGAAVFAIEHGLVPAADDI